MNWPKSVPILEASDIYQGGGYHKGEKSCLLGWNMKVFGIQHASLWSTFKANLYGKHGMSIAAFSDNSPKKSVARVWNKTMADFGYTVGNPEAHKS